jgi:hypothetical protein
MATHSATLDSGEVAHVELSRTETAQAAQVAVDRWTIRVERDEDSAFVLAHAGELVSWNYRTDTVIAATAVSCGTSRLTWSEAQIWYARPDLNAAVAATLKGLAAMTQALVGAPRSSTRLQNSVTAATARLEAWTALPPDKK